MDKPSYLPPPEAWAHLPPDYSEMSVEQRARALQKAGSAMVEDVLREMLGENFDDRRKPSLDS